MDHIVIDGADWALLASLDGFFAVPDAGLHLTTHGNPSGYLASWRITGGWLILGSISATLVHAS